MKLTSGNKLIASVLCLATAFSGFLTAESSGSAYLFKNKTAFDKDVYFAQSSTKVSQEKELSECLFRVAGQISMRKEVFVRYILTNEKDSNGKIRKSENVLLDYDQNNSLAILEKLTVLKISQADSGTEALIKLSGKTGFKCPLLSIKTLLDSNGNPGWVSKPPKGTKFYSSVGSTSQTSNLSDAYINADTNAIGPLAPFLSKPVVSGNTTMYETVMKGVYIARRWYNPKLNCYYSLAILPK